MATIRFEDLAIDYKKPRGVGTCATVYEATFLPEKLDVAVKEIDAFNPVLLRQGMTEAVTLLAHPHPHSLRCFGYCLHTFADLDPDSKRRARRFLYIVLERAKGDLKHVACASDSEKFLYCGQVVLAVDHLHTNGLVHRDIKLANILVLESGDAVLADAGIVRTATLAAGDDPTDIGASRDATSFPPSHPPNPHPSRLHCCRDAVSYGARAA